MDFEPQICDGEDGSKMLRNCATTLVPWRDCFSVVLRVNCDVAEH